WSYVCANTFYGGEAFVTPVVWHSGKSNSAIIAVGGKVDRAAGTAKLYAFRLHHTQVTRSFGLHGGLYFRNYANETVTARAGNTEFTLNDLLVREFSTGIVFSGKRGTTISLDSSSLENMQNHLGYYTHWFEWYVYFDLT